MEALKRILKSVYSHFSYDISSYIAGKLDLQPKNGKTGWDGSTAGARPFLRSHLARTRETDEEVGDADEGEESSIDDDEEDSYETHYETDQSVHGSDCQDAERNMSMTSAAAATSGSNSERPAGSKAPAKLISSFTVENILMGRQHSSCSSSSNGSSMSSSSVIAAGATPQAPPPIPAYSPTSTSPPVNIAHAQAIPLCTSSAASSSSSIVGVNWVSHPPVKYTKFTMLSPTAMSDEALRKKKVNYEPSALLPAKSSRISAGSATLNETAMLQQHLIPSALQPAVSTAVVTRENATVASSTSSSKTSAIQVYPIASLKEVPATSSNSITTAAGRLCPLAVATPIPSAAAAAAVNSHSLDRKSTLSQGFSQQPPQQYVFIIPSNSVAMTQSHSSSSSSSSSQPLFPVLTDDASQTKRTNKSVIIGSSSSSSSTNTSLLHQSDTMSSQPLQTSTAPAVNSKKLVNMFAMEKTSKSASAATEANSTSSFRLIAPKQIPHMGSPDSERRGSKPRGIKRGSHKPHKLRFHMTTVVTKQKQEPVLGSMTVESPSAVMIEIPTRTSNSTSPTSSAEDGLDKNVAIESTITFSPNLYSVEGKCSYKGPETAGSSVSRYKDSKQEKLQVSSEEENTPTDQERRKGASKEALRDTASESKAKGRTTRNYTRRKRELTFHLYEEPGATFRVKKACKE